MVAKLAQGASKVYQTAPTSRIEIMGRVGTIVFVVSGLSKRGMCVRVLAMINPRVSQSASGIDWTHCHASSPFVVLLLFFETQRDR